MYGSEAVARIERLEALLSELCLAIRDRDQNRTGAKTLDYEADRIMRELAVDPENSLTHPA